VPERRDVHDLPMTYVTPFRFGPFSLVAMALGVVIAIAGIVSDVPEDPKLILIAGGLAIPFAVLLLLGPPVLRRRAALRVDADGVFFEGRPPLFKLTSAYARWEAIEAIYLFKVRHGFYVATYVGLEGRDGVAPIETLLPKSVARTIPHVPLEIVMASRPVYNWRLDKQALKNASPVPVVDLTAVVGAQTGLSP
jgi:hypothetical protein